MKIIQNEVDGYEETSTELIKDKTIRGFGIITFMDRYEQDCSLQDSSLATEAAIWLGVDNTGRQIEGPKGQRNEDVGVRMHLTQAMVKQLLPFLTKFAETGEYLSRMEISESKVATKKKTKKKSSK